MIRIMHHNHELQQRGGIVIVTNSDGETSRVLVAGEIDKMDSDQLNRIIIEAARPRVKAL